MTKAYSKGEKVAWNWGAGEGEGRVAEIHTERVERTINGTTLTRNASNECPAYLIKQDDGSRALKLHSELKKS
ncbi:MAG: DUF2945 domain-containing protein [Oceanicaulis sp.]